MPELPEVETITRNLRDGLEDCPSLLGMTVRRADILWERTLATPPPDQFLQRIIGQTIQGIKRRGKFLVFTLTDEYLLFHLRMSGDLWLENADREASDADHNRLVLHFIAPWRLVFNDPRKFGRVWLLGNPEEVLDGLGPEPLDKAFTAQELYVRLQPTHRQLKPLLLDQTFLAGIGNIYADEALNLAKLHPLMSSHDVSQEQAEQLWHAIRSVLNEGIRRNGASIDWVYRGGDFQNYFRVYGRKDLPCPECGTVVQKTVVGQRGTYYCPNCQVRTG